ncbi:hypothetical protein V1517DRAFT_322752 [Lipomyces orientalis]|uniref:Uncharacterized protein n=1 Tax=Lipomyces orientalis TaxID=1233043 RepID=A0ACC3TND0_9ASCO
MFPMNSPIPIFAHLCLILPSKPVCTDICVHGDPTRAGNIHFDCLISVPAPSKVKLVSVNSMTLAMCTLARVLISYNRVERGVKRDGHNV